MIVINDLSYQYPRNSRQILKSVSLSVRSGEIVALMGKNGSGKSTIGKLVAGICRPPKKHVFVDGLDVGVKKNYQKIFEKIGIVFQNPETQILFNKIDDEMEFGLDKDAKLDRQIDDALDQVGMLSHRQENLWELSLGQKQRIVLAEMLVRKPKYLVLDEPTSMMDDVGKKSMYILIRSLCTQGLGILLITNSTEEARIADRILTLQDGFIL